MSKQQRTSFANYLKVSDRHQICMPVHSAFFPLLSQTRAMHQPNLFLCPFTSFLRGHTTFLLLASCLLQHPSKIFFNLLPFFFSFDSLRISHCTITQKKNEIQFPRPYSSECPFACFTCTALAGGCTGKPSAQQVWAVLKLAARMGFSL